MFFAEVPATFINFVVMEKEKSEEKKNTYRSILKGTSLLGGVQMFQILLTLVRGKFVAMLLGPDGMGLNSLFQSAANTVNQTASLGLNLAIVRETVEAKKNEDRLATFVRVVRMLMIATSLLGMLFCVAFAPWLSQITFGSGDYAWQFVMLGVAVFFMVYGNGTGSLLQGLHELKIISRISVIGGVVSVGAGIPLYYFFGTKGIVPAISLMAMTITVSQIVALRRILPGKYVKFSWHEHKPLIKKLVTTGILLLSATLISTICGYMLNVVVRVMGELDDVGFYNAASSLTSQYSGVVFMAMSLDYFPRLAEVNGNNREMREIVNRQIEIVSVLIAPVAIIAVGFAPWILQLLYTREFIGISPLVRWMALGVVIKALAYPRGFIAFAKDNRWLFFWLEGVVSNVLFLLMGIGGYYLFGLPGLGYGMLVENLLLWLVYYGVNRRIYGYRLNRKAFFSSAASVFLPAGAFMATLLSDEMAGYYLIALFFLGSAAFTFLKLRKMLRAKE